MKWGLILFLFLLGAGITVVVLEMQKAQKRKKLQEELAQLPHYEDTGLSAEGETTVEFVERESGVLQPRPGEAETEMINSSAVLVTQ